MVQRLDPDGNRVFGDGVILYENPIDSLRWRQNLLRLVLDGLSGVLSFGRTLMVRYSKRLVWFRVTSCSRLARTET